MGILHQLLATEPDLALKAKNALGELSNKFGNIEVYLGQQRTYQPLIDGGMALPAENKKLPGRVMSDIAEIYALFLDWMRVSLQKEITNVATRADVVVDGEVLLKNMPAPALLNLEHKLAELLRVLKKIPTNDLAQTWTWDSNLNAYVSNPKTSYREEKRLKTLVKYEATKEHPAQVETYTEATPVGEWTTIVVSGAIPLMEKKILVARLEKLYLAIKNARQEANQAEIVDVDMEALIAYINNVG